MVIMAGVARTGISPDLSSDYNVFVCKNTNYFIDNWPIEQFFDYRTDISETMMVFAI